MFNRVYHTKEVTGKVRGGDTIIEINGNNSKQFIDNIVDILARSYIENYFQKSTIESQNNQRYNADDVDVQ